jgi:ABC-type oligopeptide transport system substrate-binding subunit
VAAALVLASCGGGSSDDGDGKGSSSGGAGGSFSMAIAEPEAFAPTSQCYSTDCSQIINTIFTGLLQVDPKTTEQQPLMAESIDSEDGAKWTIKLKDGFTFHNGEKVTAQSFVDAWNYTAYAPNATQLGFFFGKVKGYDDLQGEKPKAKEMSGLKAVDDLTIEVQLSAPFSQWPLVMSYTPAFAPIAQECLKDIKACNEKPIGNGPYEFVKWDHKQSVTLKKWDKYSDEATAGQADEIVLKVYGDLKTAYRDFEAGNLDLIEKVDPSQRPAAAAKYKDQVKKFEDGSYTYMGFPFYVKEFANPDIRKALSMAVDRQSVIDGVLNGDYQPATDVIPGFVPGGRDDACEFCKYDPDQAKKLFEQAGGIPGNKIEIWFNTDGGNETWVQAIAQGWKQTLGLDFEFKAQPFDDYLETLGTRSKAKGPYRLGWGPDYPSPENYLDPLYGAGSTNYGDWKGPQQDEFLKLVAKANSASTIEDGVPDYQKAADVILDNVVVIPLWFGQTFTLISDRIDNVGYSPTDRFPLQEITVKG